MIINEIYFLYDSNAQYTVEKCTHALEMDTLHNGACPQMNLIIKTSVQDVRHIFVKKTRVKLCNSQWGSGGRVGLK